MSINYISHEIVPGMSVFYKHKLILFVFCLNDYKEFQYDFFLFYLIEIPARLGGSLKTKG